MTGSAGPSVFISYAHADEAWKNDLVVHLRAALRRDPAIELWSDRQIGVGKSWREEIDQALGRARVAVLIVSSHFLASDFISDVEVPRLLDRWKREGVHLLPLLVRPCPWQRSEWLSSIQMRPTDAVPLTEHPSVDRALSDFAVEVAELLDDPETPPPPPLDPLDAWFDHVIDANRRLADGFERPHRLDLIEEAWVELELQPGTKPGPELAHSLRSKKTPGPEPGSRWKLADALALGAEDADWITRRWLLEGSPGSGKTTLLRHYARTLAAKRDRQRIPVFVSLARAVEADEPLLRLVTDGFQVARRGDVVDALENAGREGRLVVLLDGLDEVPPERRQAAQTLLGFLGRDWRECPIVLSTRPLGRGQVPDGFSRLELLPLSEDRQLEFLRKWFAGESTESTDEDPARHVFGALHADRGLHYLASVPLYLTLFALLWHKRGALPDHQAELYDEIFLLLLEGQHRLVPSPIPAQADVREALRHLAFGLTRDEHAGETPGQLERRLREPGLAEVVRRLRTEPPWNRSLRRFLDDVFEQTQILGPHNGASEPWCFWHRTFREALAAEYLAASLEAAGPNEIDWPGLLAGKAEALDLEAKDEGRWAEPLALLAGRLDEPDALVTKLAEIKPRLALRSMVFTQGLEAETLLRTLGLTDDLDQRAQVFEQIPDQLDDPRACLELVERLKDSKPGGFDLFWLGWILDQVESRWPGFAKECQSAQRRLFEHIPAPDPELFRFVETPRDGRVKLWCAIPAGEGWIGFPDDKEGRYGDKGPRHRLTITRPFYMAAVPVTRAQYAAFDQSRIDPSKPDHPVAEIGWYEAMAFCRWLSTLEGFEGARLPTEEEWEYTCRAGTETRYWKGDAESDLAAIGWYEANSGDSTHAVGEKEANPWGLYDAHGNVDEWTASAWKDDYSSQRAGVTINPAAPLAELAAISPRDDRVVRGGNYWFYAQGASSGFRAGDGPGLQIPFLGFRVLLPFAPSETQ